MIEALIKLEIEMRMNCKIDQFERFMQGKSRVTKYSFYINQKKFIAKYYRPGKNNHYYTSVFGEMKKKGINIIEIEKDFYSVVLFKYCIIMKWMDGKVLDLKNSTFTREELYGLAEMAARELKSIHTFPIDKTRKLDLYKEYLRTKRFLIKKKIDVPHLNEFIKILDIALKENNDSLYGMTHLDFHAGNIIYRNDSAVIIDTETFDITHPWRDFSYALCINSLCENTYWMSFILAYFDWNIPDEFWEISRNYVLYHFVKLLISNYLNHSLESMYPLAEKIYDEYDGMKSNIPKWVESSLRKLKSGDKINE